jgi:hypothetical protein
VDALVWAVLAWMAWRYRSWLAVHGWQICAVLFVFQSIGLVVQGVKFQNRSLDIQEMPADLARFSSQGNVIHIVLDAFQANVFEHLVDLEPGLRDEFEGFTFFRDTLAPSDVTYLSVPATLTGKVFDNRIPISTYHEQTLGGDNLYRFLAELDYAVDVATPLWWHQSNDAISSYFMVPTPYADREEALNSSSLLLFDISLFRQVPHFLKASVYREGAWLLSNKLVSRPEQQFEHFSHNEFLRDYISRVRVTPDRPSYKFLHLVTPHAPLVSNEDCSFTGKELSYSMETFSNQTRCTLQTTVGLLRKLKQEGVYRQSLVMIHGDHGGGVAFEMRGKDGLPTDSMRALNHMWGNPLPVLMVKPPDAEGPLRVSDKQVSLTDIPATVAELLDSEHGFPGESVFSVGNGAPRVRNYYLSTVHRNEAMAKDRFDNFSHYTVRGSIYDVASWSEADFYQVTATNEVGRYDWGTSLSFGVRGNFKPFQNGGWTMTRTEGITWTKGNAAGLSIPFPASEKDIRMSVKLKPLLEPGKLDRQRVTVKADGHEVAQWELTENRFQELELVIPAELINGNGETRLDFILPDARTPASLGQNRDRRVLALAFLNLQFNQLEE